MNVQIKVALTILRRRQVGVATGLSRSTIYSRIKAKTFPPAVQLGARSVGWRAGDIDAFLSNPAVLRLEVANTVLSEVRTPDDEMEPPLSSATMYSLLELARVSAESLTDHIERVANWTNERCLMEAPE